jgi:Flp pilus assembly secretin CpaC
VTPMLRACCLGVSLLAVTSSLATAADQAVTLRLGIGSALTLDRPFTTVLIGDPFVVDVREQSDHTVILEPLEVGATNVVFVDAQSIAITNVRILVCKAGTVRIKYQDGHECEPVDAGESPSK